MKIKAVKREIRETQEATTRKAIGNSDEFQVFYV